MRRSSSVAVEHLQCSLHAFAVRNSLLIQTQQSSYRNRWQTKVFYYEILPNLSSDQLLRLGLIPPPPALPGLALLKPSVLSLCQPLSGFCHRNILMLILCLAISILLQRSHISVLEVVTPNDIYEGVNSSVMQCCFSVTFSYGGQTTLCLQKITHHSICSWFAAVMAKNPETRKELIEAKIPCYFYPFLKPSGDDKPLEYLRLTSLGVLGSLAKVSIQ
ncbi:hypothetical protein KY289_031150 [Solanum tuberosum]|nr:hypothetical protein KY289_031150 [Solanum tuberosum]